MKKMVFSAVALVAFSFAGMANNEVKEVEVKETKKEETIVKTNCSSYAMASTIAESNYYGYTMTNSEFASAYTFYYNTCVDANNSGATLLQPVFVG